MKLIDNVRGIWKHYSTWALSTVASLGVTWASVPEDIKAQLPHSVGQAVAWVVTIVAILGIGAKCIDQSQQGPAP